MNPLNLPHILSHHMPNGYPQGKIFVDQGEENSPCEEELITRLIKAYLLSKKNASKQKKYVG